MIGRPSFAYVVEVEGAWITLNLGDAFRGTYAAGIDGVTAVTEVGAMFCVEHGSSLIVMRVQSLGFAEPKEAQRSDAGRGLSSGSLAREPLRNIKATVVGLLVRNAGKRDFVPETLVSPALGARAFPLTDRDMAIVLSVPVGNDGISLRLGHECRSGLPVDVSLGGLLGRHTAILGSTGQGKSSFTAAMLQQVIKLPQPRVVVFDINGEFERAVKPHLKPTELRVTTLGADPAKRIPYYALGRSGLARLLLPSEKTQRPALNFALDSLPYVKWHPTNGGVSLVSNATATLFDDARPGTAADLDQASRTIASLRAKAGLQMATTWPPMAALAALAAESHSIKPGRNGPERDSFLYGNVAPLITRIRRQVDDDFFKKVVNVDGGPPSVAGVLSWQDESDRFVNDIFGSNNEPWKVHILNLRNVAHDHLPLVLSSILELFAHRIFVRGQDATFPTLLVLEEAHHYLREIGPDTDNLQNALAYERLAKEGRKFGVSLWLSTQRPSEVSATVLSQCGTWVVFRLASEQDLRAVANAAEWIDRKELERIAGLPRQQALVLGCSVRTPVRLVAHTADPTPQSTDPNFTRWNEVPRLASAASQQPTVRVPQTAAAPKATTEIDEDVPF